MDRQRKGFMIWCRKTRFEDFVLVQAEDSLGQTFRLKFAVDVTDDKIVRSWEEDYWIEE